MSDDYCNMERRILLICFSFTSVLDMDRNAPERRSGS